MPFDARYHKPFQTSQKQEQKEEEQNIKWRPATVTYFVFAYRDCVEYLLWRDMFDFGRQKDVAVVVRLRFGLQKSRLIDATQMK